jgi:hypothetical protein
MSSEDSEPIQLLQGTLDMIVQHETQRWRKMAGRVERLLVEESWRCTV